MLMYTINDIKKSKYNKKEIKNTIIENLDKIHYHKFSLL